MFALPTMAQTQADYNLVICGTRVCSANCHDLSKISSVELKSEQIYWAVCFYCVKEEYRQGVMLRCRDFSICGRKCTLRFYGTV